jgi:hypothetical protein
MVVVVVLGVHHHIVRWRIYSTLVLLNTTHFIVGVRGLSPLSIFFNTFQNMNVSFCPAVINVDSGASALLIVHSVGKLFINSNFMQNFRIRILFPNIKCI